jgi:ribosome-associated protein
MMPSSPTSHSRPTRARRATEAAPAAGPGSLPQPRPLRPLRAAKPGKPKTSAVQTQTFRLSGDYIELNQLLKLAGACDSGGAGKALVASGAVQVDGQRELRKTCKIRAGQTVRFQALQIEVIAA